MSMPRVEYRWTMGNILTLVALFLQVIVVASGGLWYASKLEARIEANTTEFRTKDTIHDEKIGDFSAQQKVITAKLAVAETNYGRMDERLIAMQSILLKIDNSLNQLRRE